MAKFQVTGTVAFHVDITVDAENEDQAEEKVKDMEYASLIEDSGEPKVEIDSVDEVRAPKKTPKKKT